MSNYLTEPKIKGIPFYFEKHYQNNNICKDLHDVQDVQHVQENFWEYGPYRRGPYWRLNPYVENEWVPPRRWGPRRWW